MNLKYGGRLDNWRLSMTGTVVEGNMFESDKPNINPGEWTSVHGVKTFNQDGERFETGARWYALGPQGPTSPPPP